LIPLPLFAIRNFSLMSWVTAVMSFGMLGLFFPITIYLQSALGLSALQAGLTVAPQALVAMVVAPWSGRLADKVGGKYILMAGLVLFAAGMSLVDWRAAPDSTWLTFLPAFILAGFGMGCIFAPLNTVAMRNVEPRMAGAAAGVLNTTRQLGGVVGSAVVGAVLQNRLATALRDEAVTRSSQLPPQIPAAVRAHLVGTLAAAGKGGLEVGPTQQGGLHAPPGVPVPLAHQVQQFFHDVFVHGYLDAMRPTLAVPVIMLLVGALSCLAIVRRRQAAEPGRAYGATVAQADAADRTMLLLGVLCCLAIVRRRQTGPQPNGAVPVQADGADRTMLLLCALSCLALARRRQAAERGREDGAVPAQADAAVDG